MLLVEFVSNGLVMLPNQGGFLNGSSFLLSGFKFAMSRTRKSKRFKERDDYVLYTFTGDDIALAHERSCAMGILPSSYTHGHGRITGCLGEIAVNPFLPRSRYVGDEVFTHDITFRKHKVEVKSKICSGCPKNTFSAFLNGKKDIEYDHDVVVFTRVRRDLVFAYIVGWLPTPTFFDEATFYNKGDTDATGFSFMSSGYQIPISELNHPRDLKSI